MSVLNAVRPDILPVSARWKVEAREEGHVEVEEVEEEVVVEDQAEDRVTIVARLDICRGIVPRSAPRVDHSVRAAAAAAEEAEARVTGAARRDIFPGTVRTDRKGAHLVALMIASVTTAEREDICHETALMPAAEELEEVVEAAAAVENVSRVDQRITSSATVPRRQPVVEDQMEHQACVATTAMRWDTSLVTVQSRHELPALSVRPQWMRRLCGYRAS